MQLGALFSSWSGLGNEPLFTVSFGAGVAIRMVMYELTPTWMAKYLTNTLKDIKVVLPNADEVVREREREKW